MKMTSKQSAEDWQLQCSDIKQRGEYLLNTETLSDCSFVVGADTDQVVVRAHKLILAMASPVFETMLFGPLAERTDLVTIPDINPMVFKALLRYIYTDNIKIKKAPVACELYNIAQKYMLPHLKAKCIEYLSSNLSIEYVCLVYEFALAIDERPLIQKCEKIIQDETMAITLSKGFDELLPETVFKIFSMEKLNVQNELYLFEAAERYAFGKNSGVATFYFEVDKIKLEPKSRVSDNPWTWNDDGEFTVVHSPVFYIRKLPWRITVKHMRCTFFGLYLHCIEESSEPWSCKAKVDMKLIPHNKTKPTSWSFEQLFRKGKGWGRLVSWIATENFYIKEDVTITVEAHIIAEAPTGISWQDKKQCETEDSKKLLARKLLQHVRFLTLSAEELTEYPHLNSLLTETEIAAIKQNIESPDTSTPMPDGFSTNRTKRCEIGESEFTKKIKR